MKCKSCKQNKIGLLLWLFGERYCLRCEEYLIQQRLSNINYDEQESIKKLKEVYDEKDSNN